MQRSTLSAVGTTGRIFQHKNAHLFGVRGGVAGRGTVLQAGRSRFRFPMGLLGIFIDLILLAALWAWDRLSL